MATIFELAELLDHEAELKLWRNDGKWEAVLEVYPTLDEDGYTIRHRDGLLSVAVDSAVEELRKRKGGEG